MKRRFLAMLIVTASLITVKCIAAPNPPPTANVPNDVRALATPTDTLLAYKTTDLHKGDAQAVVIVIRHKINGQNDYDFDNNPCELIVLSRGHGNLTEVDHSTKAVDCTYNDVARHAPAMSLNDNLSVAPGRIFYINQKDKGGSTFYFAWSKEKNTWFLQSATASNADGNHVTDASASYPKDFEWITMSSVDPDAIAHILEKHENVIE